MRKFLSGYDPGVSAVRPKLHDERSLVSAGDQASHLSLREFVGKEMGRTGRVVGTRELVVPDTPYIIPYRVKRNRLEVIAIFHGRQRWPAKL